MLLPWYWETYCAFLRRAAAQWHGPETPLNEDVSEVVVCIIPTCHIPSNCDRACSWEPSSKSKFGFPLPMRPSPFRVGLSFWAA